jgi:Schlafen group 3, DNA/RNA helicase domain
VAAQRHAESLLHSVHAYLAEAQRGESPPSENIVIFDEAQRAWDQAKMQKMAGRQRSFGAVPEVIALAQRLCGPAVVGALEVAQSIMLNAAKTALTRRMTLEKRLQPQPFVGVLQ